MFYNERNHYVGTVSPFNYLIKKWIHLPSGQRIFSINKIILAKWQNACVKIYGFKFLWPCMWNADKI